MTLTTVTCDVCNSLVELGKKENGILVATCDCGEMRSLKTAKAFPEGWL